ncbi:MAG: hypothetical protein QM723_28340 [Myxococcaceae bacterium]
MVLDPFAGLPNVLSQAPVAGELKSLGGTEVKAKAYRVKLKPREAMEWVVDSFRRLDLYVPPPDKQFEISGMPQITGYDGPNQRSYTAIFEDNHDGTTTLIAGTADLANYKWATGGHSLPVFPGASGAVESQTEQGTVLSYQVTAKPEELDSFYAQVFSDAGWKRDEQSGGWLKAGQLVTVSQRGKPGGALTVSLVSRRVGSK